MNIFSGSVHIGASDVIAVLSGHDDNLIAGYIIMQHRLPQAITALFAGAAISVAGLLLQTSFHNPLAGPSVLGISGGASLGVAIVMLASSCLGISDAQFPVMLAAFVGAMAVTSLLLLLSSILRRDVILLIVGMLLSYLISALITILNAVATPSSLHTYVMWGMADFSAVSMQQLPLFVTMVAIMLSMALLISKPLNAMQLGDAYAQNLGVNLRIMRHAILLLVGGITAVTTAYCGPVSFIGLAVPHISRLLMGKASNALLLPSTLIVGAATGLLCSWFTTIPSTTILPLNAVTPFIGIPVIIWVVAKR